MDTWWGPGRAQCCACLTWRDDVVGSPHTPRFYICRGCVLECATIICKWQELVHEYPVSGTGRVSAPPPGGADSAAPTNEIEPKEK